MSSMSSIEGLRLLADTVDAVEDKTRDIWAEKLDVQNQTLKQLHKKAQKIVKDAKRDSFFDALGSIGKVLTFWR